MTAPAIRQCGTVCEAFYFDPSYAVSVAASHKDADEEIVSRPITPAIREFSRLSQGHFSVAMMMGQLNRNRLASVAACLRMGLPGDHLPYPADYVARKLATLPQEDQADAWELFGEGVEP